MADQQHTPSRRAMLAGLTAAPVAGLPAIAGAAMSDDPIFAAFAEFERAKAADQAISKAADELRGETYSAIKAAGVDPRTILTHRKLENWREMSLCSDDDYAAGLAELEAPNEHQKMLMRLEESDEADMESGWAAGASQRALCETPPTTRDGALRLLRHLADFLDEGDVVNDLHLGDVVGDAIRNAVEVLEREAQS